MNEPQEFLERLDTVCTELSAFEDILSMQEFHQLKARKHNLKEALEQEKEKNRVLRIGIIGSVKAGKSTFLNALLFKGENILPKAATPMTASLTRLCHTEKPFARFIFYTEEDWDIIESEADKAEELIEKELRRQEELQRKRQEKISAHTMTYNIPPVTREDVLRQINLPLELRACMELKRTTRSSGLDIHTYLGKEEEIEIRDANDIRNELGRYIGSKGTLTPVVKYVVLGINNDMLRDLEIIDTPGLNDPVCSRSQETYKFMAQCDAAFILSRAGQFLTEEDVALIEKTLIGCGIRHQIIIATQMDLSAQNEVGKTASYREAFQRSRRAVVKSASRHKLPFDPICISAFMASYAYKKNNNLPLDAEDHQMEKNISKFSEECPASEKDFRLFSGMNAVYKKLDEWRKEKDRIILDHQYHRMEEALHDVIDILNRLLKGVDKDKRMLHENDIGSLRKKHSQIHQAMNSVSSQITELFLGMKNNVNNELAELGQRIVANSSKFDNIQVVKHTEQKESSQTSGILFWKKTTHTTETIATFSADLSEAIQQLKNFAAHGEKNINDTFKVLLNKDNIESRIKRTILPVFRDLDIHFDEDIIILPISALLHNINVPNFQFNNDSYNQLLVGKFSGGIHSEKVAEFKAEFQLQIQELCKDIRTRLDAQRKEISDLLLRESSEFSRRLLTSLDEQMTRMEKQMSTREESLRRYDDAKNMLQKCYDKMVGAAHVC